MTTQKQATRPRTQQPMVFTRLFRKMTFLGGPYISKPDGIPGIKLAKEINRPYDHKIDIEDFSTPTPAELLRATEVAIKMALIKGSVYSGCMGGIGRTGTLMSAIAKVFIEPYRDPVEYVRDVYLGHAVETDAQRLLVRDLDVSSIQKQLTKWVLLAWIGRLKV